MTVFELITKLNGTFEQIKIVDASDFSKVYYIGAAKDAPTVYAPVKVVDIGLAGECMVFKIDYF